MKLVKNLTVAALTLTILGSPLAGIAAEGKQPAKPAKPYTLTTCAVSGEKLGDEAYTFTHEGREIKLCCKDCLKDFNKNPAKYLKKVDQEEAKAAKAKKAG